MNFIEDIKNSAAKKAQKIFFKTVRQSTDDELLAIMISVGKETAKDICNQIDQGVTTDTVRERYDVK
jgi:hypothetical protein